MAFPTNHLSLSLTPRADVREQVIEAIAKFDTTSHTTLPVALFACHDIIGILRAAALAMRASNLLFNQNGQLLPEIEVLER